MCGVQQVAVVVLRRWVVDIGTHLQERGKISMISMDFSIERRMNCLFITAGGRKVRTFELVGCSDQCPQPPNPPSPKGGRGADYQSISDVVLFRLRLKHLSLLLLHLGKSLKTAGLIHDFCSNLLLLFLECLGLCWLI